jgi:hypothetical protein
MTPTPRSTREMTVGQLAVRSGVTVSALHFYEAQGLIAARRSCQLANPEDVLGCHGAGPRRLSPAVRSNPAGPP